MADKILFIDRDGTLIHEPDDFQVDRLDKVHFVDAVVPSLLQLRDHGFRFVMVSNQDGLGTDAFPQADFDAPHALVINLFKSQGIRFDEIFICPHLPKDKCECRKPRTGLLTRFLAGNDVDLGASAVIGDRKTDVELAERIGVAGLLVNCDDPGAMTWPQIVDHLCHSDRTASVERNTNETRIAVTVNLDSANGTSISSGIGFFDHMLEQIARHGGFGLQLQCRGDLDVDEHHTVEDVAIAIGTALRQDKVGELSTEMVEHFFRSLAESLAAALHIEVHGKNTHHMIEACFKSVGRCLRQAVNRDGTELPSTKGTL